MSNNTVNITGFLSIGRAAASASRTRSALVEGWINTSDDLIGGRHPFRAEERQALVILEHARLAGSQACGPVGVSAHARLVSHSDRSYLDIKFISFFDTSNPLVRRRDGFAQSSANLQGFLTIRGENYLNLEQSYGLLGCLATGNSAQGGQHPVLISGEELAALRQDAHFQEAFRKFKRVTLAATLSGTLFTRREIIYVLAGFLSLDTRSAQEDARPAVQTRSSGLYTP